MPRFVARRRLNHSADRIFDLVADVERYPDFLPWWVAARITRREPDGYETDQVIRIGPIRQRFASHTLLDPPGRILVTGGGGRLRRLRLEWKFEPVPADRVDVELGVHIILRSAALDKLFAGFIERTAEGIISAFEKRAAHLRAVTLARNLEA